MFVPLHARLTPDQRRALLELRHDPELQPRVRLRVEALWFSAGGMKVPQLAAHLDCCEVTVRSLLHRFTERGLAAVYPQPTGFPPDLARRRRMEAVPDRLPGPPRAWTVTTLSEALAAEADIHLKPSTLRHRQDPQLAAAARTTLAGLKQSAGTGSWTSSSSMKPACPLPAAHLHPGPCGRATGRPLWEPTGPTRERPGGARNLQTRAPDPAHGTPPLEGGAWSRLPAPDPARAYGPPAHRDPRPRRHPPLPDGPASPSGVGRARPPAVVPAGPGPELNDIERVFRAPCPRPCPGAPSRPPGR